jgi:hypothetical protein
MQALDLFSLPAAPNVWLQRRVTDLAAAMVTPTSLQGARTLNPNTTLFERVQLLESAVWWTPAEGHVSNENKRRLEGEIHLSKTLAPTSAMAHFAVEVRIFHPFFDRFYNTVFLQMLSVLHSRFPLRRDRVSS